MARSYPASDCPVACALDLVGDRWTLLILRDLSLHPARRFQDFVESLKGCAPNTLSTRLAALERDGLVERRLYEERPPRMEYLLTAKGREAAPVLRALRNWGLKLQAADTGRR
ncbi:MAG: winged helix-turn-helix transcriptional regulator [Burkholderiaceae bacterium]